jgi:inner membrane protein
VDPISQGALGAAFSQATAKKEKLRAAGLLGCLAGMSADLDVFINSSTDPLLFLEYHRHFTHALLFIPFGAAIVTLVLYRLFRHRLSLSQAYAAALIGYATHGLLDACTSYGTQLFWPFSDVRIAWNNVSVVDPMFTIPLLVFVITSVIRHNPRIALGGVVWALFYLGLGVVQHDRAYAVAQQVAQAQGHNATRLTVKPGFANLIVWKSIYEHDGIYHVDAIRVLTDGQWCPGKQVEKLDIAKHLPDLQLDSQQAADIERFRWFSDDYLAPYGAPGEIIDVRYAAVPNDINPLWGIQVDTAAGPNVHASFVPNRRATPEQTQSLIDLVSGQSCRPVSSEI